jgi:putative membrane protein insertion efficiency factor
MKFLALASIRFYQSTLSPMLPSTCRFYPTCSAYAYEAVEKWGVWRGAGMTVRRLLRCRPFGEHGYDPVPERLVSGASSRFQVEAGGWEEANSARF